MRTLAAAEANRQFSTVLREMAAGQSCVVLLRGRPVATIAPIGKSAGRQRAKSEDLHAGLTWRGVMVANPLAEPVHPLLADS